MLQKGAEELEKKIAAFTTIIWQLKTAAITLWVALIGWAFTIKIDLLIADCSRMRYGEGMQ
ncbi:hypothetical protein [Microseira wollei]|uniref:Uncharacterized protein n=1 Tax=Microseira wollei NIES-4236 TaxID=2530354 RepID=A0AAV3XQB3_9CYAN|nr:hypothetical protein [Microseira wollei]GET43873.1 hypothetical protein MiSe_86990 [Microseira wollei NIES-4236]